MTSRNPCPTLPEPLEPARVQPCFEGMDDTADYAQTMGREPLEGGLWLPMEVSHG
jgi:hypothetical protein